MQTKPGDKIRVSLAAPESLAGFTGIVRKPTRPTTGPVYAELFTLSGKWYGTRRLLRSHILPR
jgi:hypothetical protein